MKHDWNLTGARCSRARKKRRNNSNTLTDIVGSGNGHVVRVNAGTDGKGLGQLETAVGIVGQDKRATVLTTQDGKNALGRTEPKTRRKHGPHRGDDDGDHWTLLLSSAC
jgi:hypothetical protein